MNREIKRRTDVVEIVSSDDAIIRLVGAIMLETNGEWIVARRYMSLETLARVSDVPDIRLPAVASRSEPGPAEGRRSCTTPSDTIREGGALAGSASQAVEIAVVFEWLASKAAAALSAQRHREAHGRVN